MRSGILALDERLLQTTRVGPIAGAGAMVAPVELAVLLLAGVAAALLTNLLRLHLGIPGSSIVFAVFPMALGFALVPRRGAGLVMGGAALAADLALAAAGVRLDGVGAQASLLLTGPLLDLSLRRAERGWRLYAAFVLACLASNAAAFAVRGGTRLLGLWGAGAGGGRDMASWLPQAAWTYAAAGVLAGLVSVAVWFQLRERPRKAGAA
ncbi:MAG TPA: hypothetical protein VFK09_04915 [Gemmatimonadales bacterium]|nr:hypothetical protein [Gemmatimonadales bacterium]